MNGSEFEVLCAVSPSTEIVTAGEMD
jgi:hypothetical protein